MANYNDKQGETLTPVVDRRSFAKVLLAGAGASVIAGLTPLNPFEVESAYAAPTSAEKQAEADEAKRKLDAWAAELDKASADYDTALEAHNVALSKMSEAETSIQSAEAEVTKLQERLGNRAASMYKKGEISFLQVLFGAHSFTEFASTWEILNDISDDDAALIAQSKEAKQTAETARDDYQAQEKIAEQKQNEAAEIKTKVEETVAATQAQIAALEAEVAELIEQERIAEEERRRAAAEAAIAAGIGGGGGGTPPQYVPATGNAIVDRALGCLGLPYVWGAVGPAGYDCSGLVSYALSGRHVRLGTTYTFMTWPRVSDPQPGDVCTHSSHCGIYYGGGRMVHASTYGVGVIIGGVQGGMIYVRR